MATRFERLYELPAIQYIDGAPVILLAGVLSKDTETGSIIAQLKFQSVSDKWIKAIKVSLTAQDISGTIVEGINDYQYLELNIANGQEFGANKAIIMPSTVTRSFSVSSLIVVFNDGSMWESAGNFVALPSTRSLSVVFNKTELEKQYRIETNESATCIPTEAKGLWQCACGTWNKGTTCTRCRIFKDKVFSAFDTATLTEHMNARLVKEQETREAEAARQAQLRAEADIRRKKNRKKLTKFAIISLVAAILLTAGIAIYMKVTEPTIEKLLLLYTQNDVISLLGKPDYAEYNSYDVRFMGEDFYLEFDYEGDTVNDFSLVFRYPGTDDFETAEDLVGYDLTSRDKEISEKVLKDVEASFTEKYGDPEISYPTLDTIIFKWIINDRMIELCDYGVKGDMAAMYAAFSIDVNCDHQSFCKHTDTKKEHLDPTCADDGYDQTRCTICGYIDKTVLPAFGHNESAEITKQATCTEAGTQVLTCAVCNNRAEEHIPALGHDYEQVTTKAAGCTTEGLYTYTCRRCNDSYTEVISALGHSMTNATCTRDGACSHCGLIGESAYGHNWEYDYWYDSSGNLHEYCECTHCGEDYVYNIDVVCTALPWQHDYEDFTIDSVYLSSETGVFVDDNGEIVVCAWIGLNTSGSDYGCYVNYDIYNSAGHLMESWSDSFSAHSSYNYIVTNLPDNDTYYIVFS